MKVLRGTAAWIEGKKYKEGESIPQKYEKEFEKFLVEVPDPVVTKETTKSKEAPKAKDIKNTK